MLESDGESGRRRERRRRSRMGRRALRPWPPFLLVVGGGEREKERGFKRERERGFKREGGLAAAACALSHTLLSSPLNKERIFIVEG